MKKIFIFLTILLATACSEKSITGCNSSGINLTEYHQIKVGDNQSDVNNIIDPNNTWINDDVYIKCVKDFSKKTEEHKYYYTYKYLGENDGYALITYMVDYTDKISFSLPKVYSKEMYNLK